MPRAPKSTTRASAAASSRTDPLRSTKSGKSKSNGKQKSAAVKSQESPSDQEDAKQRIKPEIDGENAKPSIVKNGMDNEPNYLLLVHMTLSDDPMITRLLSLPPRLSFDMFHEVLQIAFGWANCHMHSFNVMLSNPDETHPFPRHVACLEPMMGDSPLDLGDIRIDESDVLLIDVFSRAIFSRDVFRNTEWEASKVTPKLELGLEYVYDHGDSWSHQITLGPCGSRSSSGDRRIRCPFIALSWRGGPPVRGGLRECAWVATFEGGLR